MRVLIKIESSTLLQCQEALSMAFALASFDHFIQLQIDNGMFGLMLDDPTSKIANMLASIALYDLPAAWISDDNFKKLQELQRVTSNKFAWAEQLHIADLNEVDNNTFDVALVL